MAIFLLFVFPAVSSAQGVVTPNPDPTIPCPSGNCPVGVLCPGGDCTPDPEAQSIIAQIKEWIHDAFNGGANLIERFWQLMKLLWNYLCGVLQQLHTQIEATKCHDPDCKSYGVTPTP